MAKRRGKRGTGGRLGDNSSRRRTQIRVRAAAEYGQHALRLIHPRCARQRSDDLEEVRKMLAAGEVEIATDELRWLLDGCSDAVEIHRLLGDLSYAAGDLRLARGHYGYSYDIVLAALPARPPRGSLPYEIAENQSFFLAAAGLARCLWKLDKQGKAKRVVETLLNLDPSDPLGVAALADKEPRGSGGADGADQGSGCANS